MINSCKNCYYGLNQCIKTGQDTQERLWQPCDDYVYEPGCDIEETIEYDAILMCQGANIEDIEIEIRYNEDCI